MSVLKMKPKTKRAFEEWGIPVREGKVVEETTRNRKKLVRFSDDKEISPFTNKPDYKWSWKGYYKKEK